MLRRSAPALVAFLVLCAPALRAQKERLRQKLTDRQPYRCHECGWRKWRDVEFLSANPDVRPDDLRTGRGTPPVSTADVDQLDPS